MTWGEDVYDDIFYVVSTGNRRFEATDDEGQVAEFVVVVIRSSPPPSPPRKTSSSLCCDKLMPSNCIALYVSSVTSNVLISTVLHRRMFGRCT